ncbi:fungal-specific transcription factor domain-containing protein [Fusarium redolens]|uniref:Fungal-specific transcription factor domain-containing protein n=1 Tax=Fusarium redolens TaxID=48865 RepID=A0A9P9GDK3_FUSRE|nr:fungal-specific transcription factor domain-containing protein [Fusarium redolens]KAH7237076.1 fungal-specific transcription factor domain-containing protein [Fusarium redolens]
MNGASDFQQLQDSPYHSDASAPAPKTPRVLACNHCQHRKVKCNRVFPCNNCIKANVPCVPSTPAPPRKRRAPNALLQERIKNLEALLEQYTSQDSPKQSSDTSGLSHDPMEISARSSPAQSNGHGAQTPTGPGKLVVRNGGYKFLDSYIWGRIHENISEMRHILDEDTSDEENCHSSDSPAPHEDDDLLLAKISSLSINDQAPLPFQILRLWQVFLERVNPITKMIHTPTTEHLVIGAMTNHSDISHKNRALLYAIYLVSAVTLTGEEAMTMLGLHKDEALQIFTQGLKMALNKVNFLRNYDMVVLQALVLYLIALQGRSNHDAVWVLSGVVIRIAHKMGVHRDGEALGLTPFDTEMRRRVWWRIIILDCMYAATSGMNPTLLPLGCDTKLPHNINDADFSPESTVIQNKQGTTEMAFALVLYEIVHFVKDHQMTDFEHLLLGGQDVEPGTPEYDLYHESLDKLTHLADEFDKKMSEVEKQYCDPSGGPLHVFALAFRPHILREVRTMATPMEETPEWGTEVKNSHDNFFRIWLAHNENEHALHDLISNGPFAYSSKSHFHFDSLIFLAGQLVHRSPVGDFTERTWSLFDRFYRNHEELWNLSQHKHFQLARLLLKAWEPRQMALQQLGTPLEIPDCVQKLRIAVSQAGLSWMSPRDVPFQPMNGVNQGSIDQMQDGTNGNLSTDMFQSPPMTGDWSMSGNLPTMDSMDTQTPVLPIFGFFNSTTW